MKSVQYSSTTPAKLGGDLLPIKRLLLILIDLDSFSINAFNSYEINWHNYQITQERLLMLVEFAHKKVQTLFLAFTQVASEWKPANNLGSVCLHLCGIDINYAFSCWEASPISENTNHHFGCSYFLTSFRGFSGERKIIVNALFIICYSFFSFSLLLFFLPERVFIFRGVLKHGGDPLIHFPLYLFMARCMPSRA